MRGAILLSFLLCVFMVSALTVDVELRKGESYVFRGKNITLLNLDSKDDKVVVCVNNRKVIISDEKRIDNLRIDLKKVEDNIARFEFESGCSNCECDEECDNSACFFTWGDREETIGEDTNEMLDEEIEIINLNVKEIETKKQDFNIFGFGIVLILIVVILGLIVLIRNKK